MSQVQRAAVTTTDDLASHWPGWPVYGLTDDLLPTIEKWTQAGHRVAVATLVNVIGSSPRPLGSEMAICDTGEAAGYVSGGCVEAAVAAEALAVMQTGKPRLLDYGAGSPVLDIQLECGGRIGIFVRELADATGHAARLRAARDGRAAIGISIDLETGDQSWFTGDDYDAMRGVDGRASVFIKTCLPPIRLVLVGGNPVALALAHMASPLGYEVTLLRPYGPAEPPPDTPLVRYDRRALEHALADTPMDAWTAVYALTHHAEDDLMVLAHALPSPAFCVGVLGSRGKIRQRLDCLREAGVDARARARLKAPAGLEIGAHGPHEIALAILAQIVSLQPQAPSRLLADHAGLLPRTSAASSACSNAG
ncbi:MAG TPA: XdhC family protein [Rhodanobacteraceae bacterium]|nr:XdhC family protein [Rhodanobacteraceae bacterium]